jgi:hydrogenase/urease accessory protein HupE
MGMKHILSGADHVAFLLALLLSTWNLKALFKVVTAFTLGHSLSLALVALGVWAPSARWVECAIALSIVYVALENLRKRRGRRPELVSLAFGLVHGMGFAGALTELNLSARQIPAVLVLFNAGVELGQLLLLALVVPLLAQARKKTWYVQRAEPVGSLALLACGFVWFLARLS